MIKIITTLFAALALASCASIDSSPPQAASSAARSSPVSLKIIGLNDFHGNLETLGRPITVSGEDGKKHRVHVAGAAYLASAVKARIGNARNHLVISAGDLIGASPLVSSYFLDEPAVGAMNRLGLDFNAVGNHEFDRGWKELRRVAKGGCTKFSLREPCALEKHYSGARFEFLAANVKTRDGHTLFAPYAIRKFGHGKSGFSVAVIGLTLKETPTLVTPSGVDGLHFADEAQTINALIPALEAKGADAIVVAIHQGLYTKVGYNDHSCGGVSGGLIDILKRLSPRVDLVISGHTHRAYVCDFSAIDPARHFLVTSAGYGGSFLTDITLTIDPKAGRVIAKHADNVLIQGQAKPNKDKTSNGAPSAADPAFPRYDPDPAIAAYVGRYVAASHDAANRIVGRITGDPRAPATATSESSLGNAIADAQLMATRNAGAQIAFMNNSGIRGGGLTPDPDGTVRFGQIYTVQPFGNTLVTKSFTGAQLLALLEQEFDDEGFVQTFSASKGFALSYDMSRPIGHRVVSASLEGKPIDPHATYRVTMNSFLASGGDSFTVFTKGTEPSVGPVDLDALEAWLGKVPLRTLPEVGRIHELDKPAD